MTLLSSQLTLSLTSTIKSIIYLSPFIYILSNEVSIYDQYTYDCIQVIPSDAILITADQNQKGILSCNGVGMLSLLDYNDGDETIKEMIKKERVLTAFDILYHQQSIHNTNINLESSHQQAALTYLKQLNFEQTLLHWHEAHLEVSEILQLFPELCVKNMPEGQVITKDIIGRNVKNITDFVISILKQQSVDPSSIHAECDAVKTYVSNAYTALMAYLWNEHQHHSSHMVDVALFRLMIKMNDDRVKEFVSQTNECEIEDIKNELEEKGYYDALAQFYIQKNHPREALMIWKQIDEGTLQEEGINGLKKACSYLRNTINDMIINLIQEFSEWILLKSPEAGLKVFTLGDVSTAPIYQSILNLISKLDDVTAKEYREKYIKYLILMNHVEDSNLNTEYIQNQINHLIEKAEQLNVSLEVYKIEDTPTEVKQERLEILQLLQTNRYYDPATILNQIQNKSLYFEQIILLSKCNQFYEALKLIITELKSIRFACECCHHYCSLNKNINPNPWCILLEILFKEEDEEKKEAFREAGIRVLIEHAYEIDLMMALPLIPTDIPSEQLMPYYQLIIPHSTNLTREARICLGMEQVKLTEKKNHLITLKNKAVAVEHEQKCAICGKMFTKDATIALTLKNEIVHEECLNNHEKESKIVFTDMI